MLALLGLIAVVLLFTLIRGFASQGEYDANERAERCESDFGYLLQNESYGFAAQDSHLWGGFRAACGTEMENYTRFVDARSTARLAGNDCTGLGERIDAELLAQLESFGECDGEPLADGYEASDRPAPTPPVDVPAPDTPVILEKPLWPGGPAIGWNEAAAHAGTTQRVCGPLRSVRATPDGTFVNVGKDYPSDDRFTFIFWDVELTSITPGSTICGRGSIYLYDGGVAQMEMRDPAALELWP